MSDLLKQQFRATNGFDAGGNKVINVAKADRNVKTDGVSVEFLTQENTIQEYDPNRGYMAGFAVTNDRRVWVANENIAWPDGKAGTFNPAKWTSLRTDPNWITVYQAGERVIRSGEFLNIDTNAGVNMTLKLPVDADTVNGDTIVIRDVGGKPGYNEVNIVAQTDARSIYYNGTSLRELRLTRPYSTLYFTMSNNRWIVTLDEFGDTAKIITPQGNIRWEVQAGDNVVRRYDTNAEIFVTLPKFANNNEIIRFTDLDGTSPTNHMTIYTFDPADPTVSIGKLGQTSLQVRTSGDGFLVFDSTNPTNKIWRVFENDLRTRVKILRDNANLMPNESVTVFGTDNVTQKTITLTLPTDVAPGDQVSIAMNYIRKGQKVIIQTPAAIPPAVRDTIATNKKLLQFPKRSEYPPDAEWVQVNSLEFDGTTDYISILKLAYIEDADKSYWIVTANELEVERVDATQPQRVGVIALATAAQTNMQGNGSKELAVSPYMLDQRRATEP